MNAGDLDRLILIERVTSTPDEFNAPVEKWVELAKVWASKVDLRDRERLAAGAVSSEMMTRFKIRWSTIVSDVNPKDRISYDGLIFDIFSVRELGRHGGIEITAAARND